MLSHQETMNPGTTLFIIIGVIGLLLYVVKAIHEGTGEAVKAIKAIKGIKAIKAIKGIKGIKGVEADKAVETVKAVESFTSFEQNGVLSSPPLGDINSLMNAFGTPDISNSSNSMVNALTNISTPPTLAPPMPSLSISASIPSLTAIPAPSDTIHIQAPIIPSVAEGLNSLAPSLIGNAQTISDTQGSILSNNKRTEAFAANDITSELLKGKKKKSIRHTHHVKKCPPVPDMSLYIRKDQIPCWGCVLK